MGRGATFVANSKNMAKLTADQFNILHDRLFEKYEAECVAQKKEIPTVQSHRYGFDPLSPKGLPSLKDYIETACAISLRHIKVETRNNLYNNRVKIDKNGEKQVDVTDKQLQYYLHYLQVKTLAALLGDMPDNGGAPAPTAQAYVGYFWSYVKNEIQTCEVTIDWNIDQPNITMKGFHQTEANTVTYTGSGRKANQYLFINLKAKRTDWEDEFSMIGHLNNTVNPAGEECIRCLFLGVSSYNYPSGGEMVLVRKDLAHDQALAEAQHITLSRYLLLKHNRIRTKVRGTEGSLRNLTVKGFYPVNIAHMVGTYKVIHFNGQGDVVISKFVIRKDFKTTFYTNVLQNNFSEQVCLMEVSSILNNRLCITTHPETGAGIISCVMLNIPGANVNIFPGAFCSVGDERPVAGKIVLLRTTDTSDFMQTIEKPFEKIPRSKDENLQKAFKQLVKITKTVPPMP